MFMKVIYTLGTYERVKAAHNEIAYKTHARSRRPNLFSPFLVSTGKMKMQPDVPHEVYMKDQKYSLGAREDANSRRCFSAKFQKLSPEWKKFCKCVPRDGLTPTRYCKGDGDDEDEEDDNVDDEVDDEDDGDDEGDDEDEGDGEEDEDVDEKETKNSNCASWHCSLLKWMVWYLPVDVSYASSDGLLGFR
ncbi:hypothetical protein HELRODRAFT_166117 [Helobdella robusta]|uniref:Uncharacterized protein n=1 Tax=Helobdella robusta TaxID=6412 RepID=T1EXS9_HELRO|nr:hypothetical protein HELRODRAFT_166117 [Helobdella robusta]ESN90451.1 hypothetical protein HELRODRAFT_166117 [Helobdella robusta]